MENSIHLPSFSEMSAIFGSLNVTTCPSEAHGILCGVICAGFRMNGVSWLNFIEGAINETEVTDIESVRETLVNLYEIASNQLRDSEMNFHLLLPADDEALSARALSLTLWCQGFLYGVGLAGIQSEETLSDDSREALYHISEISKLDIDNIVTSEDDEKCFMEVVEYIRMAVLMIYADFASVSRMAHEYETLH